MQRLMALGVLCGITLLFALPTGARAEEQTWQERCAELELSAKSATEGPPFANMTAEQKEAFIAEVVAPCRAEQAQAEADDARREAEEVQREEREATKESERESERLAERRRHEREKAAQIRRARHHICMEVAGGCWIRPHKMPYGAHASIYGIHWRSWGPHRAVGIGHILWRHTITEPHFGPYRAKLVLTEPGECGDTGTWYSRRTLTIKRGDVVERNQLFGPCNPYY